MHRTDRPNLCCSEAKEQNTNDSKKEMQVNANSNVIVNSPVINVDSNIKGN